MEPSPQRQRRYLTDRELRQTFAGIAAAIVLSALIIALAYTTSPAKNCTSLGGDACPIIAR